MGDSQTGGVCVDLTAAVGSVACYVVLCWLHTTSAVVR